jgi:ParB family chromosome partitioning protein
LKKVDEFFDLPLSKALARRKDRAEKVLELDRAVTEAVAALKERGLQSPYLRAFVVARVNPLRFHKGPSPTFDATVSKMLSSARNFKAGSVKMDQLARAGGALEE